MPSLLQLPVEIRLYIFDYVLEATLPPPATPSEYDRDREALRSNSDSDRRLYPGGALRATCRQLAGEVQSRVTRLRRSRTLRYDLDVMLHEERRLLPTWTRVPALCARVDTVRLSFRIFGASSREARNSYSGCTEMAPLASWFYDFLCGFRRHGPRPRAVRLAALGPGPPASLWTMRMLELDFRTPAALQPGEAVQPSYLANVDRVNLNAGASDLIEYHAAAAREQGLPPLERGVCYLMSARSLMDSVRERLHRATQRNLHIPTYETILFECVGHVRFLIDGEFQEDLDVARRLVDFRPDGSVGTLRKGSTEMQSLTQLQARLYRIRESAGLPVIYPK